MQNSNNTLAWYLCAASAAVTSMWIYLLVKWML